ncbi:MAG: DUF6259 domain-containing protein [Armatimonadota bacterium]|nr:DUF6259 domain-containing protein [Armatimonadota bacterium]
MRYHLFFLLPAILCLMPCLSYAAVERRGDAFVLSGDSYAVSFSAANGSVLAATQTGKTGSILRSGEQGLWHARFRDNTEIKAADFRADSAERSFKAEADAGANALQMTFRSAEITVEISATGRADGIEFIARIKPEKNAALDFALPARLRFDPDQVQRFICPMNGNQSVGAAFNRAFFQPQPKDKPVGWRPEAVGTKGYATLYGGPLDQRPDRDPPTALRVTPEGRQWLGSGLAQRIEGTEVVVNRPPTRAQAELVLVDSANGPYFSASHLGGTGFIWRIGGSVGETEKAKAADMVMAALEKLAASTPASRRKLGLAALARGPERGGWAAVAIDEWRDRFQRSRAAVSGKVQVVEIATPAALSEALASNDFLAILNPYGEWSPVVANGDMQATVQAIGRYVRAGGNWFEVGGYPFYYALQPLLFLNFGTTYPAAFADFFHLDSAVGSASIYGVQPKLAPWAGAQNKAAIFVPGRLACGGDEQGGYCDRPFATFVAPGATWQSPAVRLTFGSPADKSLLAYCQANEIKRTLKDKMSPALLEKFKNSVLVFYAGNAREKTAHLDLLPVPSLVHFSDYLKGGFDKQYPDHLPPRPDFGTPQEFRAFFDRSHELGHLVMPYTNYTWWCDHPRGPTFEREGEAPLLRLLDGKLSYERYNLNDGYTVCHWHPAVQAASRNVVRQFREEYPVDVLFQDQCGARTWHYDTNPASPTPYAYIEGLLSQVQEDAARVPLSTEAGWDKVVNDESQLCGMSFGIVPTEYGPAWRRLMKYEYPVETWEIFPLAQYIAHDKTSMLYHDLGQFVTNREVLSWTLGLGFGMSYRVQASALKNPAQREWLRWLDRIQKSVCARYVGEPVTEFKHDRGPTPTVEDDGVIRASYGPIKVVSNLGPQPRTEAGRELPSYGFFVTGPGLTAGNLKRVSATDFGDEGVSFVIEGTSGKADVWVYAPPEREVAMEVPTGRAASVSLTFDNQATQKQTVTDGVLRFRLPNLPGQQRVEPPAELAGKAPRDWPGAKPAIGVLNFGRGLEPNWTRSKPEDWLQAFGNSRLAKEWGVPIKSITTVEELIAALQAGPRSWLAIVNPYGEKLPVEAPGKWREMLDRIRRYVENGGNWWETAGHSFHQGISSKGAGWEESPIGPSGMGYLGLTMGNGEVEEPTESLRATPEGRRWLGDELSAQVEKSASMVNRGLPRGSNDPGHLTLVAGKDRDFIGGYRLNGWGWLWRIGGFSPNPDVTLPVAVATTEYLYTHPAQPLPGGGIKYLWHAVVTGG